MLFAPGQHFAVLPVGVYLLPFVSRPVWCRMN